MLSGCPRDPPFRAYFPQLPISEGKDPCSLIPAPCSLPLLQVPRTPYCPVRPQEAALPAALGQLAALSRPPTSHLAFYERPRPRAATLDRRILRRTIERRREKRAEILSQITPTSTPARTPAAHGQWSRPPSPKFHRCTGPGTSWGRENGTFATEDPEFIKAADIPSPPSQLRSCC